MLKALNKLHTERMYFKIIKTVYNKVTVNITINCEEVKVFPLDQEQKKDVNFCCYFYST